MVKTNDRTVAVPIAFSGQFYAVRFGKAVSVGDDRLQGTDRLIDDFAAALDLVIPDGSLTNRYTQLLSSVRTMQRFENSRFR